MLPAAPRGGCGMPWGCLPLTGLRASPALLRWPAWQAETRRPGGGVGDDRLQTDALVLRRKAGYRFSRGLPYILPSPAEFTTRSRGPTDASEGLLRRDGPRPVSVRLGSQGTKTFRFSSAQAGSPGTGGPHHGSWPTPASPMPCGKADAGLQSSNSYPPHSKECTFTSRQQKTT